MAYEINKGAGRPAEVLGVKGMANIYRLAGYTVAGLVISIVIILLISELPNYLVFGAYVASIFIYHNYLVRKCRKYGEHGSVKDQGRSRAPQLITVHSSKVFRELRKTTKLEK